MSIGSPPHRLTPSILVAGAVSYITTRHGTPSECAAYAQAWAAFPALTVINPFLRLSSGRASAAAKNPLTLKLPVGCKHSSFSNAPSTGTIGVRCTCGRARSAAARMRSRSITLKMVAMPIYEYRCEECGKRSSALLPSYSSPDPVCPHCGKPALRRLVSTFATARSGEDGGDDFGGDEMGGEDFGGDSDGDGGGFDDGDDL